MARSKSNIFRRTISLIVLLIIFENGMKATCTKRIPGYIGCYPDKLERDLNGKFTLINQNSVEACRKFCQGFTYFGLENSRECYCGNSYGKYGKADESTCNKYCPGNRAQLCGAHWRLSVHRTDGQEEQEPTKIPDIEPPKIPETEPTKIPGIGVGGYIGCYVDNHDRDLHERMLETTTNSIQNCRKTCQGFVYFGLQATNLCFCGNNYGNYGKADEHNCNEKCSGHKEQICGGAWRNSIYRTDGQQHKEFP